MEDALQSFLKVSGEEGREGVDSNQNCPGGLVFPKDIIRFLVGANFVCLFYGKIRTTWRAYKKYTFPDPLNQTPGRGAEISNILQSLT